MAGKRNDLQGGDPSRRIPPQNGQGTAPILRRSTEGLRLLLDAYHYAEDVGRSVWDFAVEIETLRQAGWSNSEFRWLVCKGFVLHAVETTQATDERRSFRQPRQAPGLIFAAKTCFALTEAGIQFAAGALESPAPQSEPNLAAVPSRVNSAPDVPRPRWDPERQELCVGGMVVKQFKVPAANQERILAAFEEDGWPIRIDDPLPPGSDQDPKRRLHDTINSLNRNQKRHLLRFIGDGTGQGIRWELVEPSA